MIKFVNKVWGSENWLVNNKKYCAKFLNLKKGYQCSYHYHKKKDETFYCLEGCVKLIVEKKLYTLATGQQIRIKPKQKHKFNAITDTAKILEVSTQHFDSDSYRITPSGKIPPNLV